MPLGFAYEIIKDLVALATMEEADPIDPGTLDANELATMGLIDAHDIDPCSWTAPRKLFVRTEAPDATHEVVWVTDNLKRTKRKVVRLTYSGNLDLILIRNKEADS